MTLRSILFHLVIAFLSVHLLAQPVSQIEGYLEVYHPVDTTSIYIGIEAGRTVDALFFKNNLVIGNFSGASLTSGASNSFFGNNAGERNTTGFKNSFFGMEAGVNNETGGLNSFFGQAAGKNSSASWNSFFGANAGFHNTAGHSNCFFGNSAGFNNTTAVSNSFFGSLSGSSNTSGNSNCFFGNQTGHSNSSGFSNSYFGTFAGLKSETGSQNSYFGYGSGYEIFGSNNVCLGANAGPIAGHGKVSNRLYIDNSQSNSPLIYGEFDNELLQINGTLTMGNTNHFEGNDDGLIRSSSEPSSDLFLVSNDALIIELDDDNSETGNFEIWDGEDQVLLKMLDGGQFEIWDGQPSNNRNLLLEANGDLSINGVMTVGALGSAGATAVCRNASGELSLCSSSIRYKNNVHPFTNGLELLRQLRPVTFHWKDNGQSDLGLIAEEVNAVEPLLTTTNAQGQVEGVKYDRLGVVLINAMKEQQKLIEELQKENELWKREHQSDKEQIRILQSANAQLKASFDSMQNTMVAVQNRLNQLENQLNKNN